MDQIATGSLVFEHENFDGPLPPTINFSRDKSKYVVSCVEDRANWAHLFFEWANELPMTEIQTTRPASNEELDSDAESGSSDLVSDEEDEDDSV